MRSLILTSAVLLAFLPGCGGKPSRTSLVVYSPHGKDLLQEFEHRFESVHQDVDVQWLDMGSQDALDRIRTERQNPQADLWWGGPMTMFEQAEEEGLLERYIPSWDTCVAPAAKSSQGFWYGTFFTPEVILYNTTMLQASDVPKDWDDLLAPAWKGKILIRAPLASGTMRIVFSAIIERERERSGTTDAGFQWLKRLDANTKAYVSDPSQLYIRIARGEAPLSIWNLPDIAMEASRAGYPFAYVLPASGSPMITDGIALVKGGKHMDAARLFYEFVTTTESMLLQSRAFYRIPARRDIPADSLPSWLAGRVWTPMKIDWRSIAQHEGEWMKQWEEEVKGNGATADQGTH